MRMTLFIGLILMVSTWTSEALSSADTTQSLPTTTTTTNNKNNLGNTLDDHAPPSLQFPTRVPVAIVGGGLGGLAVCVALRSQGIDAHIFESSPALVGRGSTGTGIMISTNGWKALESIAGGDDRNDSRLVEEMQSFGSDITNQTIYKSDPSGVIEKSISIGASGQYNVGWTRAHEVLLGNVPPEVIHCGCHFESYQSAEDSDTNPNKNTVDICFQDGRTVRSSLLIGADGAGSAIRRFMANKNAKTKEAAASSYETKYSGQLLWNAMLPTRDINPTGKDIHGTGEVKYTLCGNDGQVILAFDAGENQTSWYLTLMEDAIHNTDNSQFTQLRTALQDGTFGGFGRTGIRAQLEQIFAPWPIAVQCLQATPEHQIFERRLADRPTLMQWADTSQSGGYSRVVLMGDAAHPMIPSQGQGTMMSWEDAADLAACVGPYVLLEEKGGGDVGGKKGGRLSTAVGDYVARRAKRCARVQRWSAKAYMGNKLPISRPKKILRMLWLKRNMDDVKDGYEPKKIMPVSENRITKRSRLLKLFGLFRK